MTDKELTFEERRQAALKYMHGVRPYSAFSRSLRGLLPNSSVNCAAGDDGLLKYELTLPLSGCDTAAQKKALDLFDAIRDQEIAARAALKAVAAKCEALIVGMAVTSEQLQLERHTPEWACRIVRRRHESDHDRAEWQNYSTSVLRTLVRGGTPSAPAQPDDDHAPDDEPSQHDGTF